MKTNLLKSLLKSCLLLAALPVAAWAQATPPMAESFAGVDGEHEFTVSASGVSDKGLSDSFGGLNLSYGTYLNAVQEVVIRQSINYNNPSVGRAGWNGSTRIALDHHFGTDRLQPFIGVNFGGIYGDNVRDSFAAGIEGGLKYHLQPRTFLFLLTEYSWSFRHARSVNDRFDDGQFNWGAGVGFKF